MAGFHNGERVSWKYRGAVGHGTITGVYKRGTTAANTEYSIREKDHHPGERAVLHHYGRALRRAGAGGKGTRKGKRSAERRGGYRR